MLGRFAGRDTGGRRHPAAGPGRQPTSASTASTLPQAVPPANTATADGTGNPDTSRDRSRGRRRPARGRPGWRTDQAALFVATSAAVRSFEPSMSRRSAVDQGALTALAALSRYALTSLVLDGVEAVSARTTGIRHRRRRTTFLLDLLVLLLGTAMQRGVRHCPGERLWRGGIRLIGWELANAGLAGAVTTVLAPRPRPDGTCPGETDPGGAVLGRATHGRATPDRDVPGTATTAARPAPRSRSRLLPAVPLALGVQLAERALRSRRESIPPPRVDLRPRTVATALSVASGLAAVTAVERTLAGRCGRALGTVLPGSRRWRLVGHLIVLAVLGAAGQAGLRRVFRRIEAGSGRVEPGLSSPPDNPNVSGGAASPVPWTTLGREGRRHVVTCLRAADISAVMQETAVDPIRVFVGLDSAATASERVRLAMAELDRTQAWERSALLLVSPTGSGYVNYVAVEAVECLARGDVATVTLQYSAFPSPLSLGTLDQARLQNRLLWGRINCRLDDLPPERRPQVLLFGESLGAITSQDAFLHCGTAGLDVFGIDRALWIGTPAFSRWKEQVVREDRQDVDRSCVRTVNDIGELRALPDQERDRVRFVLLDHYDDGVTRLSPDLLVAAPPWLTEERPPRGVPRTMRWTPLTTALQVAVDAKNAMAARPGDFLARGHDYRADLPEFISEVFGLPATEAQLDRLYLALRRHELEIRGRWSG